VFWTTPWAAIVIVDYFKRFGRYSAEGLMQWAAGPYWYRGGVYWPGLIAFILGVAASVACSATDTFHSPIAASWFSGADLSIEAGFLVAAGLYALLARPVRDPS
jgi:NCS1 family nucleobase:cation symporter-1